MLPAELKHNFYFEGEPFPFPVCITFFHWLATSLQVFKDKLMATNADPKTPSRSKVAISMVSLSPSSQVIAYTNLGVHATHGRWVTWTTIRHDPFTAEG